MASRGQAKLSRKAAQMAQSWQAAKSRMTSHYGAVGFGPTRVSNFNAGVGAATHRSDPDKWARNWSAKFFGSLWRNLQWISGLIQGNLNSQEHGNPEPSLFAGRCRDYTPRTQTG